MPAGNWIVRLKKCPIRKLKGLFAHFLTQLIKTPFYQLIEVKVELVKFMLLKNRLRVLREKTQVKGQKENNGSPRRIGFDYRYLQDCDHTRYVSL